MACELRWYWPRKSPSAPRIRAKPAVSAPVLAEGLGVFGLEVDAAAVLADDGFEGQAAVHVDGVAGAGHEGAGEAAHRRVRHRGAVLRDDLAGIAAGEAPFARLPLQLQHVERVLVGLRQWRR